MGLQLLPQQLLPPTHRDVTGHKFHRLIPVSEAEIWAPCVGAIISIGCQPCVRLMVQLEWVSIFVYPNEPVEWYCIIALLRY